VQKGMIGRHQVLSPAIPVAQAVGRCALAIMTKAPRAGCVKTRLSPPLTPIQAAALNVCFLRDIAGSIEHTGPQGQGIACYTPVGQEDAYHGVLPASFQLIAQREGNFGQRLAGAIEDLFRVGFASVCLINSDSPTVPASSFQRAIDILCEPNDSLVLGPSDDGGYYLIGMKRLYRRLFEQIAWSTEKVFAQTLQRASEIQVEVRLLPTAYDVDDRDALNRLYQDLLGANEPDLSTAPATREFLQRWTADVVRS
jgi:rSAM/selenodomain-associated transferase 1